ncbi:MAG: hypothetical protein IPP66_20935 [Anaerolineales bacterium]|nr:hypothetical protein [Anaerolineales bacterium]
MPRKPLLLIVLIFSLSISGCSLVQQFPPNSQFNGQVTANIAPKQTTPTALSLPEYYLSERDQERLLQLLFTNGGCDLPCFWGITPGETTWDLADVFFGTFHKINTDVSVYTDASLPAYSVPLDFIDIKNRAVILGVYLTVDKEKVQRIAIYSEADSPEDLSYYWEYYSNQWIFSQLGLPDEISFDVYQRNFDQNAGYDMLLLYQKPKIAFWLSGIIRRDKVLCPQIHENGDINSIRMSIANPDSDLEIYPPNWEFWSLRTGDDSLSTESVFGLSKEDFYQRVLVDGINCFDVVMK